MVHVTRGVQYSTHCRALVIALAVGVYYSKHIADLTENGSTVTPPETLSRGKGKDGWLQSFSHGS